MAHVSPFPIPFPSSSTIYDLISKAGVAANCGCVCCGLWVPLMWSACGRGLPWALRPLAVVYCLCVANKQSGCGSSLWVPLMWSVCGRGLPWALRPLVWLISKVGVAALCGCVSCGLWVPLMWSVCERVLLWSLRPLAGVYWPGGSL